MLASAQRVKWNPLKSLAFGSIGAAYVGLGIPLEEPIYLLKVQNFTDQNLLISFDGITDHDVIAANGGWVYDFGSNKSDASGGLWVPQGVRIYIKQEGGVAPTTGSVYAASVYASTV